MSARKIACWVSINLFVTFCGWSIVSCAAAAGLERQPNVVLILADDLGWGQLSCYGGKETVTPHIDSIAQTGVRFTEGYVTAGTCSPSRAALLTGQYQNRFGFEFNTYRPVLENGKKNTRGLDPQALTVADVLRSAGYVTGMVGKWHVGFDRRFHPTRRGFDEFYGILAGASSYFGKDRPNTYGLYRGTKVIDEPGYLTDALTREAVDFIDRHAEKSFFLYLPYTAVHKPFSASEKYLQRFPHVEDPKQRAYRAMTVALDDGVGKILTELRQQKLEERTLVIFLSDNGAAKFHDVGDNGPYRLGKLFLFEGGVRIPFLMKWPGHISPNTVNSLPVSALDLFPTICAATGSKIPDGLSLDGVDLIPWLSDKKQGVPHKHLFWRNGPNRAVRRGNWKLIQANNHVWLFDLKTDPGETQNLAEQNPNVVRELQQAFEAWQKEMQEPAWPSKFEIEGGRELIDGVEYEIHV